MNFFERRRQQKSFEFCIKQAMTVLKISKDEAGKRVRRVAEMEWLKELGTPDKREYQVAVDIIMQIPSDKPVTVETMREVTDANIKSK